MKFLLLPLLLAAGAASAQNPAPNVDRESQDASRRGALEQKAAAAAAAAKIGEDEITFEQILAAPGDVALNERYAREQIQRGDLRGAATTLERVIMLAPQRDATRLLYAAVLYRLDDPADAERELKIVQSRQATGALREEADKYMKLVAASKRLTHFDARVSFGYGYDHNRNAAPDSGTRLFVGRPVILDSRSTHQSDTNVQFAGSLGVTREIGANRHSVFARVGYFRGEQTLLDLFDLQAYSARAGGTVHTPWADFTPSVGFDHVLLSQSTYLRSLNAGVRVSRKLSRRSEVWTSLDREDQGFIKTPLLATGDERRGDQYSWALGGLYILTPFDRLSATLGHRRKLAKAVRNAYRRESLGVEYTHLLGRGMFLVAGLSGDFDRYDRADNTVSEMVRHDNAATFTLLYGAPLSLLWKPLDGFTGTLGYERFQQDSNLTNYKYSNNKLTALVSYAWGN